MEGIDLCFWILFGLNFILYGATCLMIIKRKAYTSISIRSPVLLLMAILGNFFINQIIILFRLFDINTISAFYFFFRVMMMVSLILRYERILKCNYIHKNNEREDEKYFSEKRYLFQEKYYFKILAIFLIILAIVLIILYFVDIDTIEVFFRFNLIYDFGDIDETIHDITYKLNLIVWICWNFIEHGILIFYLSRVLFKHIKEKIKLEIVLSFIIWYIYCFICSAFSLYSKQDSIDKESNLNLILTMLSIIVLYALLFLNGIFPVVLSYFYRTSISYHFNPKLMSNLYLFLTNEECYDTFYEYLKKKNDIKGLFYLKLYTHIMKYKLNFSVNIDDKSEASKDLNEIYNLYFANENYSGNFIDKPIVLKIRKDYDGLENNIIPEIFDQALQYAFLELCKIFDIFHKSNEFSELYSKIKEYSYIHCKMCNTGLINQI